MTGFGYSLTDLFENQFVDMDSIVQSKNGGILSGLGEIEEAQSPFASPKNVEWAAYPRMNISKKGKRKDANKWRTGSAKKEKHQSSTV